MSTKPHAHDSRLKLGAHLYDRLSRRGERRTGLYRLAHDFLLYAEIITASPATVSLFLVGGIRYSLIATIRCIFGRVCSQYIV